MRRLSLAAVMAASVMVTACVAPPVALTPQLQRDLEGVQVVLFSPQTNLEVAVTPGNPGSTGLLGALIVAAVDEARRKKAAETAGAVVDATREFGFGPRMAAQLRAELNRVPALRVQGPIQLEAIDSDSQRRIVYDTSRAPAVLMASLSYKLLDARLVVSADVVMYPKAARLMGFRPKPDPAHPLADGNAVYRRQFRFSSDQVAPTQIRGALNEGLANVAWQIAADMGHVAGSSDAVRTTALAPLSPAGLSLPPGAVPAPAAAVPGGPVQQAAAGAAIAPRASASADSAWQGVWAGPFRCGAYLGAADAQVANRNGWTVQARMTVTGSQARFVRGDEAYSEVLNGEIVPGGMLHLQGQGRMLQQGALPWNTTAMGQFALAASERPARFEGTARIVLPSGLTVRECTLELTRASG